MLLDAVFSCCWFGSMKGDATRETFPGVLGRELGLEILRLVSMKHLARHSHLVKLIELLLAAVPAAGTAIVHGVQHVIVLARSQVRVNHLLLVQMRLELLSLEAAVRLRGRCDDCAAARRVKGHRLLAVDAAACVGMQLSVLLVLVVAAATLPSVVSGHSLGLLGNVHGAVLLVTLLLSVRRVGGWVIKRTR